MSTPQALLTEAPWLPLAFPLLWLAVCGLLSLLGGWLELARDYRAPGPPKGVRFLTSGSVGRRYLPVHYNGCLIVRVDSDGLWLSVMFPFRFLHPPLYFPWKAVESVDEQTILFMTGTVLRVRGFERRITLSGKVTAAVCQAFDTWQGRQPRRTGAAIPTPRRPATAPSNPVLIGLGYAAFVFAFFAIAINLSPPGWAYWYRLSRSGVTTMATITQIDRQNHHSCRFAYQVNGRSFEGSQICPESLGAQVTVTYLPESPGVGTIDSPRDELNFMVLGPLLLAIFGGIFSAFRARSRQKALEKISSP